MSNLLLTIVVFLLYVQILSCTQLESSTNLNGRLARNAEGRCCDGGLNERVTSILSSELSPSSSAIGLNEDGTEHSSYPAMHAWIVCGCYS